MGSSSMWITLLLPTLLVATMAETLTLREGCLSRCGDVDIPYPFGIGKDCFYDRNFSRNNDFEILCVNSSVPVISRTGSEETIQVQVLNLSLSPPVVRVNLAVAWKCYNSSGNIARSSQGEVFNMGGIYSISSDRNELIVLGCHTTGEISSFAEGDELQRYAYNASCYTDTYDSSDLEDGSCKRGGCCSTVIPPGLSDNVVSFYDEPAMHYYHDFCRCCYAFIVEKGHYSFKKADLLNMNVNDHTSMPLSLDWAIHDYRYSSDDYPLTCDDARNLDGGYACLSTYSECFNLNNLTSTGYTCNCAQGFEGNPYIDNGCTDINECQRPMDYPCNGTCKNTKGRYQCDCPLGYRSSDPFMVPCEFIIPLAGRISIGIVAGIFLITVASFIIILRKERRHRDEIYRKNGGPTLEKASIIKLFKKEDLIPILKPSNIIGKGGFGEVYKGLLDGAWVAIKKPISGNQMETNQFANEVIIQSKVIHKNIVRLIGCCLEVDTPMLVYEFISQGSLEDILHGGEKKHLGLDSRLNIAAQSAQGLAYMHSQTNTVILHGDVKPANILLDENYAPRISDFGISRLIARDNEHAASIIGDMSYMDPVYQESGLLTAKSDVYSFGVVILELISRKVATHRDNSTLVNSFLENHKKGEKSTELFDMEIAEGAEDLLQSLTELAIKCLDLDVDQRPTMTEVAEQLVAFIRSRQV